jgi:hypothetical protein
MDFEVVAEVRLVTTGEGTDNVEVFPTEEYQSYDVVIDVVSEPSLLVSVEVDCVNVSWSDEFETGSVTLLPPCDCCSSPSSGSEDPRMMQGGERGSTRCGSPPEL